MGHNCRLVKARRSPSSPLRCVAHRCDEGGTVVRPFYPHPDSRAVNRHQRPQAERRTVGTHQIASRPSIKTGDRASALISIAAES